MAATALFLARSTDEGYPQWYVEEAERRDRAQAAADARLADSRTDHYHRGGAAGVVPW